MRLFLILSAGRTIRPGTAHARSPRVPFDFLNFLSAIPLVPVNFVPEGLVQALTEERRIQGIKLPAGVSIAVREPLVARIAPLGAGWEGRQGAGRYIVLFEGKAPDFEVPTVCIQPLGEVGFRHVEP